MKNKFDDLKNKFDLVVIGCSSGGIEALRTILQDLSIEFRIPIAIVQHRSPQSPSVMIRYFSEICKIPVCEPDDKQPIEAGQIYFAPPNYHLLIGADRRFNLNVDEAVYFSRPAVDVLFSTAAEVYQNRLLGIIMSGANADGAQGLLSVKKWGGMTVVQNPETAYSPQMPAAALKLVEPDYVLNLAQIQELIYAI